MRRYRDASQHAHLDLLQQHPVQQKMLKFHQELVSIQTPTCSTCMESFPGMKMSSPSSECQRCCRDKVVPKLYSSANNMDPGPVPSELEVRNTTLHTTYSKSLFKIAIGSVSGRRNAYFCGDANNVHLSPAPWTVRLQRSCHQPAAGPTSLCKDPATASKRAGHSHCEEGRFRQYALRPQGEKV